jgi:ornithine carbamoyltransferase
MIFEKASTRTRLSFEAGMHQLGGSAIYLNTRDSQLGRGEPVEDAAQVISRMSDIVMIRTYEQEIIERFARHSRVPVINGLTNEYHPCQILADIFTYIEHRGAIQGARWPGSAIRTTSATPGCRRPRCSTSRSTSRRRPATRSSPSARACTAPTHFEQFADPMDAARGADLVTTDVWTSMGFEAENEERLRDFADWQVDADMMRVARPEACSCTACRRIAARKCRPK